MSIRRYSDAAVRHRGRRERHARQSGRRAAPRGAPQRAVRAHRPAGCHPADRRGRITRDHRPADPGCGGGDGASARGGPHGVRYRLQRGGRSRSSRRRAAGPRSRPAGARPPGGATSSCRPQARASDLVVFARAENDESPDLSGVLEATLFGAGRPLLLLPPALPATIGERGGDRLERPRRGRARGRRRPPLPRRGRHRAGADGADLAAPRPTSPSGLWSTWRGAASPPSGASVECQRTSRWPMPSSGRRAKAAPTSW